MPLCPWIVVDSEVEFLREQIVGCLTFRTEVLPEAKREANAKNVKANLVVRGEQDLMVATARVSFRWRVGSVRIPIVNSFVLVPPDEVDQNCETEVLQEVKSFQLCGVHEGVDVHQEHQVEDGHKLGKVLNARSSSHQKKRQQFHEIDVEEVTFVEGVRKGIVKRHLRPHGVACHVHDVVDEQAANVRKENDFLAPPCSVVEGAQRSNFAHGLVDVPLLERADLL